MVNTARGRVAAAFLFLFVGLAGGGATAAAADDYVGRTPPTIPPTTTAAAAAARVLGRTETRAVSDPIPITGGDIAGLVAIGAGAVAVGTGLLRRGRRAPR